MTHGSPLQVGLVCDLLEEHWPSMDLVADELLRTLPMVAGGRIAPVRVRPAMPRWPAALAGAAHLRVLVNANRYLDRHRRYPRWLRENRGYCSAYHVLDHTYAHLVHELPAERTIVTCHDTDAFRSLVEPEREPRSAMFRRMTARLLDGLRRAALVTCDSEATRDALVSNGLRSTGLEVVRLGVHPAYTPGPPQAVPGGEQSITLLHVGSTIPRKRIDLLLQIFARVREFAPGARLVRVGGAFTAAQAAEAHALGLTGGVTVMPHLSQSELAGVYRGAALLLLPSDSEGFGLPVVEAMACGTPVLATDLAVLREVGGPAAEYAPAGDAAAWAGAIRRLLDERANSPVAWARRRQAAIAQASRFTWEACAGRMAELYLEVARA